jgi:hypothetical protein
VSPLAHNRACDADHVLVGGGDVIYPLYDPTDFNREDSFDGMTLLELSASKLTLYEQAQKRLYQENGELAALAWRKEHPDA